MSGYPDGIASHVYEQKSQDGLVIEVAYDWTARWRTVGGVWASIPVPNTTTAVDYPVQEIVSVLEE